MASVRKPCFLLLKKPAEAAELRKNLSIRQNLESLCLSHIIWKVCSLGMMSIYWIEDFLVYVLVFNIPFAGFGKWLFLQDTVTAARRGKITTRHGSFETPAFMPVGTQGTIKGVTPDHIAATGSQCILANTYHLMLRPGEKVVEHLGDLHRFMAWPGPILTDSGGYQVFSLAKINKITDEGVLFKSHIDGSMVHLNPHRSMEVQNALGADIIMAFDECPAANAPAEYHTVAVERTLRWAEQCIVAHARPNDQSLFGIVQGGTSPALRQRCAEGLIALDFPGYALGGLAVGKPIRRGKAHG